MELDSGRAKFWWSKTMCEVDFFELDTGGARARETLIASETGGARHWWDQTLLEPELEKFGKLVRLGVRAREILKSSETEEPLRLIELHAAGGKHW